jgi:LuxR family transcriptional regulator, maltose regulon positive regulatory protein
MPPSPTRPRAWSCATSSPAPSPSPPVSPPWRGSSTRGAITPRPDPRRTTPREQSPAPRSSPCSIPDRPAERARLLLALGEIEEVTRWAAERGLSDADIPAYPREREYLVLARLLLARAAPDRALSLLDRLRSAATSEGRHGSLIEIRALRALALVATSKSRCALDALVEALALARPEGYVRVFADEGASMAALLRRLVLSAQRGQMPRLTGDLLEYAVRLLNATSAEQPGLPSSPVRIAGATVLVEPLTERECEVLLLVAEGKANREIADRLVVTLDTVKKHLTHIFGKLGAVSRTQAVARARELQLLNEGVSQPRR